MPQQFVAPPVRSDDPLLELQKLASNLQQGRISIKDAYKKISEIYSTLPLSGPVQDLWWDFSTKITEAYNGGKTNSRELGYDITAIMTGDKYSEQLRKKEGVSSENSFFTPKGQKNAEITFDSLQTNASYENMKTYLENRGGVQNLSQEEITFLQPFLISGQAMYDYNSYSSDPSYLVNSYGKYSIGKNDCFSYAVIDGPNKALGESYNPGSNIARESLNGKEKQRLSLETGKKFYPLSKVSSIYLQVGDMVGVNISPNNTGNNHWGIVAMDENGVPAIIGRNSSEIGRDSIENFFSLATGFDIIRYGRSNYGEHIVFEPSSGQVRVVKGNEPGSFID